MLVHREFLNVLGPGLLATKMDVGFFWLLLVWVFFHGMMLSMFSNVVLGGGGEGES